MVKLEKQNEKLQGKSIENVTIIMNYIHISIIYRCDKKNKIYFLWTTAIEFLSMSPDRLTRRTFSYLLEMKMVNTWIKEIDKNIELQITHGDVI